MNGNSVREVLEQPFPDELIKTRPGSFGASLSYVEGHEYIKRLNDAFAGDWSFEVVSHEVDDKEAVVVGKLTAGGVVKSAFGGSDIKRAKESGEIISLADDLKSAATDSLKKCASLLGVGLHLYGSDADASTNGKPANTATPKQNRQRRTKPANGDGHGNGDTDDAPRLTSRQLGALLAIGKNQGLDREKLTDLALDRFGRRLEFLTKLEASWFIDELKAA